MNVERRAFPVRLYDLGATLTSGQAFRWECRNGTWTGVVGDRWVRLRGRETQVEAEAVGPVQSWRWLEDYLQPGVNLEEVVGSFPQDRPIQAAVASCRGLRLLRQEPWECLASFILSSTKQIVQIRQIISLLCARYGEPLRVPQGSEPAFSFPGAARLARLTESELRDCKMGFRAPHLLTAARQVAEGALTLENLHEDDYAAARRRLMELPGVGPKIADCVLLFAYGFQEAFPVDVWIMKALNQLYFPRRALTVARLREWAPAHFAPYAGFAQQYLFHYARNSPGWRP